MAFATGIAFARSFAPPSSLATLLILAGGSAWILSRPGSVPAFPRALLHSLALSLLWTGAGAWIERSRHQAFLAFPLLSSPQMAARAADHFPVPLRGWVADDPLLLKDRQHFLLQVEEAWWEGVWRRCPGVVRISLRESDARIPLAFGDRIELPVRLRAPRSFRNPGAFDYRRFLEGEGIHLVGTVKTSRLVRRLPGKRGGLEIPIHRLRARLLRRLARAFPDDGDEAARRFLEAILLGERGGGEGEFEKLLRKTGVYHILSISGLHFALLMGGLSRLLRRAPGGRRFAPALAGAVALLYVALSGGEDPILRSAISALLLGAGKWTGRRISAWDSQAQAGIALLAAHPLHLYDPGFQLSFAATFGILSCRDSRRTAHRSPRGVAGAMAISSAAWVASMPLLAAEFFQVSPLALILNFAAAPFLSGSLVLGACLLVLPCRWLGTAAELALELFSSLSRQALQIPGSFARVPPPSPLVLLAFAGLGIAYRTASTQISPDRETRRIAWFLLVLVAWIGFSPGLPRLGNRLEFVALDVGQGDAVLLRLPGGEEVLVDAGGFTGTDFDVGEKVVVPALLSLGVRHLDLLVLTHAHQDHGGGIPAVMEAFSPREIWVGRAPPHSLLLEALGRGAAEVRIPVLHPTRGSLSCLGESCFEVLHPPPLYRPGAEVSNEDSLVLRLTYRETAVLLSGDIEREGESLLLSSGISLRSDLLKVPHHGSLSSSSEPFLDLVHPAVAVISVGEGNLWDHPSPQVVHRLLSRGTMLFRTDEEGAIRLRYREGRWVREGFPE